MPVLLLVNWVCKYVTVYQQKSHHSIIKKKNNSNASLNINITTDLIDPGSCTLVDERALTFL